MAVKQCFIKTAFPVPCHEIISHHSVHLSQDPADLAKTVIVVRSLVPDGVADLDGRLYPGDRLISVNGADLADAGLEEVVWALKGAPAGAVRLGITKPIFVRAPPVACFRQHSRSMLSFR